MATSDEARKAYQRDYYEKNRERLLAAQRERGRRNYAANPEAYKARSKKWREENPERYRELTRRHAEANREKVKDRSRRWYAENRDRAAETTRRNRLKRYDLTPEQFAEMLAGQDSRCLICEQQMDPPVVDHSHRDGSVRGLLCRQCNSAIGLLQDDPAILARAIEYLTRSSSGATSTLNKPPSSELSQHGA